MLGQAELPPICLFRRSPSARFNSNLEHFEFILEHLKPFLSSTRYEIAHMLKISIHRVLFEDITSLRGEFGRRNKRNRQKNGGKTIQRSSRRDQLSPSSTPPFV